MANGFTKYWNKASDYLASDDRFYKPLWNYLLNGFTEYWNKASDYLASDNRFYKPFWNYLLLATYKWGNLLDYGSLNRTVDGNFIIEGASTKEGKLYRALTNEEKDEIIKAKRDAILRAIKEKDKEHYRAKVALFLFAIAFSIGVAFGSAAMMSHKFLDIMNHYDVALGLGEPFIAYAVFGIVFLVNVFIYFISVLSVSRMLFGHGFLSGLKLKEEAKVGINKNNEFVLRTNAEKKAEQTGQLAEGREAKDLSWDQFALQVVGMFFALVFSMSLAVLTRVNSKGGLEDMMGLAAATDASYAIAIVTLVGMFCLTSWAILGLVRVENKYQEFWKFCANVIGIDKANEITSPKKLWDNYDWRKHLVTLVIVVLFTLLCIYGLGSQGFAQAEAFTDQTQKQAGFFAASVSTTLCMLSALFGKGAFVIKAIGNSVGLYRNARSEPAKDENGNTLNEKLVVSPDAGITLKSPGWKWFAGIMIVLNGLFQSTTAITAAVGIDGDSPAGDEPSVDPIIGDPDEQPKGDSTSDVVGQVALFSAAAISATALSVNSGVSGGFAAGSTDQKKEFDEAKKEARKVAAIASF